MAIHIKIDEEDEKELARVRQELIARRLQARVSQKKVARILGYSEKWLNELETIVVHPRMSSLQDWASFFNLRVEPEITGLDEWDPQHVPPYLVATWELTYRQSRVFDARKWVRAWLMADLVARRFSSGVTAAEMSRRLGLSVSAVSGWERDGNNPLVSKVFTYTRALGGVARFRLVGRADWCQE